MEFGSRGVVGRLKGRFVRQGELKHPLAQLRMEGLDLHAEGGHTVHERYGERLERGKAGEAIEVPAPAEGPELPVALLAQELGVAMEQANLELERSTDLEAFLLVDLKEALQEVPGVDGAGGAILHDEIAQHGGHF